ncbi:hypothetical protein TWF696_000399 [Orbilia brochopaga]|uniref:F-box domain-containing protein n=1 Tax=Orbilia brochopaga TaxID=3140254 RepID=A0AAV9VB58_9PEZI
MDTVSMATIDVLATGPTPAIYSLPVEILQQIFECISDFSTHFALSTTCTLFQHIIAGSSSIRRLRYKPVTFPNSPKSKPNVAAHGLLQSPQGTSNLDNYFGCTFQAGVVHSYKYRGGSTWEWTNIPPSIFLDEPVVKPLSKEGIDRHTYDGSQPPPLIVEQQALMPPFNSPHAPSTSAYYWRRIDDKKAVATRKPVVVLELQKQSQRSTMVWHARAQLTTSTTVRELVEAIVRETALTIEQWDVDPGMVHEMLFLPMREMIQVATVVLQSGATRSLPRQSGEPGAEFSEWVPVSRDA